MVYNRKPADLLFNQDTPSSLKLVNFLNGKSGLPNHNLTFVTLQKTIAKKSRKSMSQKFILKLQGCYSDGKRAKKIITQNKERKKMGF